MTHLGHTSQPRASVCGSSVPPTQVRKKQSTTGHGIFSQGSLVASASGLHAKPVGHVTAAQSVDPDGK